MEEEEVGFGGVRGFGDPAVHGGAAVFEVREGGPEPGPDEIGPEA